MNHQKIKRILLPVAIVFVAALSALYFLSTSWIVRYHNFSKTAQRYAISGDVVSMGTLFDFEWDEDDEESIRKVCPRTFDKWWGNDVF